MSSKWSFIQHITDYLGRDKLGNQKAPTLWPSEATAIVANAHGEQVAEGKCRRATYFRYMCDWYYFNSDAYAHYQPLVEQIKEKSIPHDGYVQWIFKQGNLYEESCLQDSKESGIYIADQTQVYVPSHNVSGKVDIVALNPVTKNYSIVELKSVYGFNGNSVLGTPGERKKGQLGTPRTGHLMQIGIYQWWYAGQDERFEEGRLVYGARDTGRFAEYLIQIRPYDTDTGVQNFISYTGNCPNKTEEVVTDISIENILEQYALILRSLDSGEIPERDYSLQYSDEHISKLYDRKELPKADMERHGKRTQQLAEGKRPIKAVERGDWQCRLCKYKDICYDDKKNPINI